MKRKHLYAILAVVGLGLLLYAPNLVRGPGDDGVPPEGDPLRLEGLEAQTVDRVRIHDPDGPAVRLERGERGWRVNGHEADSTKVAELLAAVEEMRATRLVARNPDHHARLEVTAETGRTVELGTRSGEAFRFLIGSRDPGTGGRHARRPDDDRVWLLGGPVGAYATRAAEEWRERVVARLDTARARAIVLRRDGAEVTLRRAEEGAEGGWTLGDGVVADTAAVASLLRRLAELRASGFPPDSAAAAADFAEPDATLTVFAQGADAPGRTPLLSLRFLRGEAGPWLLKRAEAPGVFELAPAVAEELLPDALELAGEDASDGGDASGSGDASDGEGRTEGGP